MSSKIDVLAADKILKALGLPDDIRKRVTSATLRLESVGVPTLEVHFVVFEDATISAADHLAEYELVRIR